MMRTEAVTDIPLRFYACHPRISLCLPSCSATAHPAGRPDAVGHAAMVWSARCACVTLRSRAAAAASDASRPVAITMPGQPAPAELGQHPGARLDEEVRLRYHDQNRGGDCDFPAFLIISVLVLRMPPQALASMRRVLFSFGLGRGGGGGGRR
eukprot:SAG25_NODE_1194_length_3648_cov_2.490561_3_plen_152_part_01